MSIEKIESENHQIPVIQVYGREEKVLDEIDTSMASPEEVMKKIEQINREQCRLLGLEIATD